jgi:hypothetical protein
MQIEGFSQPNEHKIYFSGEPFRHWVVNNFLDYAWAKELSETFPKATQDWYEYKNPLEKKRATDKFGLIPHAHLTTLALMNTQWGISFLERLTGIDGLIPDPWFRGGGLHQIERGGKLDVHVDFNFHQKLKLDRRLNALLYLNENWEESWGGNLELWATDMSKCVVKIAPIFNRLVVFETTDFSFHGHPDPLNCPKDRSRNSLAWYFYSNGRPEHEKSKPHSTVFKKRPQDPDSKELDELREKRSSGRLS